MGFRPVSGSNFDFSEFIIFCKLSFGFPKMGTIGTNILMDVNK